MFSGILAFVSALIASAVVAPLCARVAVRLNVVDAPDDERKLHKVPIPLTGAQRFLSQAFLR
jgi:UDP-N-acetylmuramyl pentapeptide phosphotransferase/UDP-N-acetylglucosamine-1-phosphate transferase